MNLASSSFNCLFAWLAKFFLLPNVGCRLLKIKYHGSCMYMYRNEDKSMMSTAMTTSRTGRTEKNASQTSRQHGSVKTWLFWCTQAVQTDGNRDFSRRSYSNPLQNALGLVRRSCRAPLASPGIFRKHKAALAELARHKCLLLALGRYPLQCRLASFLLLAAALPPAFRPGKEILLRGEKTRVAELVRLYNSEGNARRWRQQRRRRRR